MNIDGESITLLSFILRDSPEDRQFIICVLARSNEDIKLDANIEYPTFYRYTKERIPHYLMEKGVISNVPREGEEKRLISSHHLSRVEVIINRDKNSGLDQKRMSISEYITLDNNTIYKDAEVFLLFRDKAHDYIRDYVSKNNGNISPFLRSKIGRIPSGDRLLSQNEEESPEWPKDAKVEGNKFEFDENNWISFGKGKTGELFNMLFQAKGNWVKVKSMTEKFENTDVRRLLNLINTKRIRGNANCKAIKIIPRKADEGAYRIQYSSNS